MRMSTENHEERPESGLRRKLFIIIFEAETRAGKIFDLSLLVAISLSILIVVLESDKNFLSQHKQTFNVLEWGLTFLFSLEYLTRIYSSRRPLKYIFSFFGLIDFLAVFPTYLSLIFPGTQLLSVLRALRLLRLFKVLNLSQFVDAASDLRGALRASRYKILIFLGSILCLVLILGTTMYLVEGDQEGFSNIPKSMYWTIVTMTTVGYGDVVPATALGKLVASFMMLVGYAIIAVPTGIVTSEMTKTSTPDLSNLPVRKQVCRACHSPLLTKAHYCHTCGEPI